MQNSVSTKKNLIFKLIILSLCTGWLVSTHFLNETPIDVGDGIMHFYISQASWSNHLLFLEHWGKPFFILLSSPFAQFGFDGIIFFNILVFGATIYFAWKILNHFSVPITLQCLFPILLLSIYDYSGTVLGGLTEPLFSLSIIIATWLIIAQRWMWFAILLSFTPFMRSEGQVVVVLALFVLAFYRQYKFIPFLLTGFLIYSCIGLSAFGDFWWYFTKSPYQIDNDIYGHGEWNHYLKSYKNYLGNVGLIIFILGSIRLTYLFYHKNWKEVQFPLVFLIYGIYFSIIILHSYFWAKGLNGSCGLTRIATQALPSFLLINFVYLGRISLLPSAKFISNFVVVGIIVLVGMKIITSPYFPKIADPLDRQIINAVNFLEKEKGKGHKFFFHHPLFVFEMGENPKKTDKNQECVFYYCPGLKQELGTTFKPGDYLIRDTHFGAREAKLPMSEFDSVPEMVLIKEFISEWQLEDDYNPEIERISIYQYIPRK